MKVYLVAAGRRDIGGRVDLETTEHLVQGSSAWVAGQNIPFKAYGIKTIMYQDQTYLFGKYQLSDIQKEYNLQIL